MKWTCPALAQDELRRRELKRCVKDLILLLLSQDVFLRARSIFRLSILRFSKPLPG